MQNIILTKRHTFYGGDHDKTLSLAISNHNIRFRIENDFEAVEMHITSDPKYMEWLLANHQDLGQLPDIYWFTIAYYEEYKSILKDLDTLMAKSYDNF